MLWLYELAHTWLCLVRLLKECSTMFIEFGSARCKIALNLLRFSEMVVRKDRTCLRVNCGDMSNVVLF